MMDRCPKCAGPMQRGDLVDQDDKVIQTTYTCKRKYWNKKKKGCGYTQRVKSNAAE